MITILAGLATFERHLIRARTDEGRKRAQAPGHSVRSEAEAHATSGPRSHCTSQRWRAAGGDRPQLQRQSLNNIETVSEAGWPHTRAVKEASPSPPPATQEIAKGSKSSEDLRRKRRAVVGLRIVRAPEVAEQGSLQGPSAPRGTLPRSPRLPQTYSNCALLTVFFQSLKPQVIGLPLTATLRYPPVAPSPGVFLVRKAMRLI